VIKLIGQNENIRALSSGV